MKRIIFILSVLTNHMFLQGQSMSGGGWHSLYMCDGFVWASGDDSDGQLGNGTITGNRTFPIQVLDPPGTGFLENISAIEAGQDFNLAISNLGALFSWGTDWVGQLGNNLPLTDNPVPTPVLNAGTYIPFDNVYRIGVASEQAYAIKHTKTVWGWGRNDNGCLGNNLIGQIIPAPTQMFEQNGAPVLMEKIDGGWNLTIGLKKDSTVWGWGVNFYGGIGNPTIPMNFNNNPFPIAVQHASGMLLDSIIDISCSASGAVLALHANGTVWSWGYGSVGQLGTNSLAHSNVPIQVLGIGGVGVLDNVVAIATGFYSSYALLSNGTVVSWGTSTNGSGQLGYATPTQTLYPLVIPNLNNVIEISAGYWHFFAKRSTCDIVAMGIDNLGRLGNFAQSYNPTRTTVYTNEFSCCIPLSLADTMGISADTVCHSTCFNGIISDQSAGISHINWSGAVFTRMSQNGEVIELCIDSALVSGDHNIYVSVHYNSNLPTSHLIFPIHVLPAPDVNLGPDQFICSGQSIPINGTTIAGATYSWEDGSSSPIRTITSGGRYILKVENAHGCNDIDTLEVQSIESFLIEQNLCVGDSILLDAGPMGIRYSWSPSTGLSDPNVRNPIAYPSSTAIYTVSVDYLGGCSATGNVTINVNPVPSFDLGPDLAICKGICFNLSIPNDICVQDIEWYYYIQDESNSQGQRRRVVVGTEMGLCQKATTSIMYCVDIVDCHGCVFTDCISINLLPPNPPKCVLFTESKPCCGVYNSSKSISDKIAPRSSEKFRIYPNPNNGAFTLSYLSKREGNGLITITNYLGQTIYAENTNLVIGEITKELSIQHLTPGIYILTLSNENEYRIKRFVVE